MSSNLARLVTDAAERHGDRPALKLDDAVLTYAQLDGATAHVAGLLEAKGLQPGDRVGIMLPNVPYFAVVYYGILSAGGVVVPMNVLLKGREVELLPLGPGAQAAVRLARLRGGRARGRRGRPAPSSSIVKPGEFEAAGRRGRAGHRDRPSATAPTPP